jgi:hypothetical protein
MIPMRYDTPHQHTYADFFYKISVLHKSRENDMNERRPKKYLHDKARQEARLLFQGHRLTI